MAWFGLKKSTGAINPRQRYIITLLGNPLDKASIPAIAAALATSTVEWATEGRALRLNASGATLAGMSLSSFFAAYPGMDWVIQPEHAPAKKLLISDMDSTMIEQECIDELADFVGKKAHVAAITERAMNGELVFEEALRERVALLAGLPVEKLQQCFDERITAMGGAKKVLDAAALTYVAAAAQAISQLMYFLMLSGRRRE